MQNPQNDLPGSGCSNSFVRSCGGDGNYTVPMTGMGRQIYQYAPGRMPREYFQPLRENFHPAAPPPSYMRGQGGGLLQAAADCTDVYYRTHRNLLRGAVPSQDGAIYGPWQW